MTERDCLRNGEWKKVNYYPINFEKLKGESMETISYFLGILSFSEDYEYFDKIKHLLIIPEESKTLEEISQEFDEKIDKLIEDTKTKFYASKTFADSKYEKKFDKIFDNFEYACKNGRFPEKLTLLYDDNLSVTGVSYASSNFIIKSGGEEVGYYTTGDGYFRYYMPTKPNFISRFCMDKLLGFKWISTK